MDILLAVFTLHILLQVSATICACCSIPSKVQQAGRTSSLLMAMCVIRSKKRVMKKTFLRMTRNGHKRWKKRHTGQQELPFATCLPPCSCFAKLLTPVLYGISITPHCLMTLCIALLLHQCPIAHTNKCPLQTFSMRRCMTWTESCSVITPRFPISQVYRKRMEVPSWHRSQTG